MGVWGVLGFILGAWEREMRGVLPLIGIDILKNSWNITKTDHDQFLRRIVTASSEFVEGAAGLNKKVRLRTYTNEKYDGGGNYCPGKRKRLYLRNYPIQSVTTLHDDIIATFGTDTKFAAADFDIVTSKSYIQLRDDSTYLSAFNVGQQNIQITYTAGYGIEIKLNENDTIDFTESAGALVATLTPAVYTPEDLATEIKTQMDSAGLETYTVTYDEAASKFTIAHAGSTLSLLWTTGANEDKSAAITLGYVSTADDTGAVTYTADDAVTGIPLDLENAVIDIALQMWKKMPAGDNRFGVKSERIGQMGTRAFMVSDVSDYATRILRAYKRISI